MAVGPLGLRPDEFWKLTYYELSLLLDGYRWRKKEQRERDAGLLANLLRPHYKRKLKPEDFLPKPKKRLSVEEREAAMSAAVGGKQATLTQQAEGLKDFIAKRKKKKEQHGH